MKTVFLVYAMRLNIMYYCYVLVTRFRYSLKLPALAERDLTGEMMELVMQ